MPTVPARMAVRPVAATAPKQPVRRFTDKPDLDPSAVWSLPTSHAALKENRTLFPSTIVEVDENFEDRLLVSGKNSRKLGDKITKGKLKGYALYQLTLEERATCSANCEARSYCYGNSMQLARRHRIGDLDLFASFLEDEIREILSVEQGLMVRLHVLGDFPSVEYVDVWRLMLSRYEALSCYGYTHWDEDDGDGTAIADAIQSVKDEYPDRFRIRWSGKARQNDGAIVISEIPTTPKFNGALVCPAQTDATACCASCGLCWESAMRKETIAFIKHGPKSATAAAEVEMGAKVPQGTSRYIRAIALPSNIVPKAIPDTKLNIRSVAPETLQIEPEYQRDLGAKSIQLIRKIVAEWDWAKFKPPVCAETDAGLFVIDGQHTAIAAASHPAIKEIPVVIAPAKMIERRAAAFVSHNRERLTMTPAQIFYGDLAAGDKDAKVIMECIVKTGAAVPRLLPGRGCWKVGQIAAVGEVRDTFRALGREGLERVLRIAVESKIAPLSKTILRALRSIMSDVAFTKARSKPDVLLSRALASIKDLDKAAELSAAENGVSRFMGCAILIDEALR